MDLESASSASSVPDETTLIEQPSDEKHNDQVSKLPLVSPLEIVSDDNEVREQNSQLWTVIREQKNMIMQLQSELDQALSNRPSLESLRPVSSSSDSEPDLQTALKYERPPAVSLTGAAGHESKRESQHTVTVDPDDIPELVPQGEADEQRAMRPLGLRFSARMLSTKSSNLSETVTDLRDGDKGEKKTTENDDQQSPESSSQTYKISLDDLRCLRVSVVSTIGKFKDSSEGAKLLVQRRQYSASRDNMTLVPLWRLIKTYDDLQELEEAAKAQVCGVNVPRLPEESMFQTLSPPKTDLRNERLTRFFEFLLDIPFLTATARKTVADFLSTDIVNDADTQEPDESLGRNVIKSGYLVKQGRSLGGWKARYFVLTGPYLNYYGPNNTLSGTINIYGAKIGRQENNDQDDGSHHHALLIMEPKKKRDGYRRHVYYAENDEERNHWIECLLSVVDEPSTSEMPRQGSLSTGSDSDSTTSNGVNRTSVLAGSSGNGSSSLATALSNSLSARSANGRSRSEPMELVASPTSNSYLSSVTVLEPAESVSAQAMSRSSSLSSEEEANNIASLFRGGRKVPQDDLTPKRRFWFRREDEADKVAVPDTSVNTVPKTLSAMDMNEYLRPLHLPTIPDSPTASGHGTQRGSYLSVLLESRKPVSPLDRIVKAGGSNGHERLFSVPLEASLEASKSTYQGCVVPIVVSRCLELLEEKNAVQEQGLFRLSGSSMTIRSLREQFEVSLDVDLVAFNAEIHTAAGLLKMFLRELPDPLVPLSSYTQVIQTDGSLLPRAECIERLRAMVEALPRANYGLLKILCGFLNKVVNNSAVNLMNLKNIGIVFAPTLSLPANVFLAFLIEYEVLFEGAEPDLSHERPILDWRNSLPDIYC